MGRILKWDWPGNPVYWESAPPTPPTVLRFEVTLPDGSPAGSSYALNVYSGPPVDQDEFPKGNWQTLIPAYMGVCTDGVCEFTGVTPGDYWFAVFSFAGYASHGIADSTTGRAVAVLPEVTTTELVTQTQWTDDVKGSYTPICMNGLSTSLNAQGEQLLSASDFLMSVPPTDGQVLIARMGVWSPFGPIITANCGDLPALYVDVAIRSSNGLFGEYCSSYCVLDDPFGVC